MRVPTYTNIRATFCFLFLVLLPGLSFGHAVGESYIFVNFREAQIDGIFEIEFHDLEEKLGVDPQGPNPSERVKESAEKVQKYILENFSIAPEGGEPYEIIFTEAKAIDNHHEGHYAQYYFKCETGPMPDVFTLTHTIGFEGDRVHRGLLCVLENSKTGKVHGGEGHVAMVFGPNSSEQTLDLNNLAHLMKPKEMVKQGVWHIWIGTDHILFLVVLLLPTVLMLKAGSIEPAEGIGRALRNLLMVVVGFSIAYTITFLLASYGYVLISSRLVESLIALSIVLVSIHNITGKIKTYSLWVVLVFGLFHGLGFASVMGHLPLRMGEPTKGIIGFNVGVEAGQLAIVAVLFPVLFLLRKQKFYVPVILKGGSIVLGLVALYWFVQRALDLG